ncbi:uncharacterized protein ACA1_128470 [Acanthamoeba castellanii str. Neff]|uniref:Ferrochelatase n=1 Tax=Acanthamoeba castellanii (strain ATCC 30010 / Neff) TaxID=1257118 RepID=L8GVB3_ACACF|nr:uncharacterized protein ACA1_128470 [Acanthamoeba castellanii str. Neff]ELR16960.1 hypothetical protein ACA1_128470 [Acanthamoeba castellanii str. Neff]
MRRCATASGLRGLRSLPRHESGSFLLRRASTDTSKPPTAVVMMNLGGPETLSDVRPFLQRLFSDQEIVQMPFPQKFQENVVGPWIAKRRHVAHDTTRTRHDTHTRHAHDGIVAADREAVRGDRGRVAHSQVDRSAGPPDGEAPRPVLPRHRAPQSVYCVPICEPADARGAGADEEGRCQARRRLHAAERADGPRGRGPVEREDDRGLLDAAGRRGAVRAAGPVRVAPRQRGRVQDPAPRAVPQPRPPALLRVRPLLARQRVASHQLHGVARPHEERAGRPGPRHSGQPPCDGGRGLSGERHRLGELQPRTGRSRRPRTREFCGLERPGPYCHLPRVRDRPPA